MGNCLGKPRKSRPHGHTLGSSPLPNNPAPSNSSSPQRIPHKSSLLSSPTGNSKKRPIATPSPNTDDERARRAEAAERRALQNQGRGIVKNGPLAQKLLAERQLSDRAILERDAQANLASKANASSQLHWTVNSTGT